MGIPEYLSAKEKADQMIAQQEIIVNDAYSAAMKTTIDPADPDGLVNPKKLKDARGLETFDAKFQEAIARAEISWLKADANILNDPFRRISLVTGRLGVQPDRLTDIIKKLQAEGSLTSNGLYQTLGQYGMGELLKSWQSAPLSYLKASDIDAVERRTGLVGKIDRDMIPMADLGKLIDYHEHQKVVPPVVYEKAPWYKPLG